MIDWLKTEWRQLALKFTQDQDLVNVYWIEIESNYTQKDRHYHNLSHIYNMLNQVESIQDVLVDLNAFKFAIWYHDIIYNISEKNNEEKSAIFAKNKLNSINIDDKSLNTIEKLIISTKKHEVILSNNSDNSFLLDLDLSILGTDWNTYQAYAQKIRKEYARYPNFMYKKGRKKILQHFLKRESLYYTNTYKSNFEIQARKNLKKELELL